MKCDACGAPVENGKCSYCGKVFSSGSGPQTVARAPADAEGPANKGTRKKGKLIYCKACGAQIAASAKKCPRCGAKNKKPLYKRWWFWLIVFFLVVALFTPKNKAVDADAGTADVKQTSRTEKTEETVQPAKQTEVPEPTAEPTQKPTAAPTPEPTATPVPMTAGQSNALKSAASYLRFSAFSYEGLIGQLEYEKYSHEDAVFAADNCGADWNEQALKSAGNYLNYTAFSYSGLIKQLEYEKFTAEQATYGADNCGADWNEQADKSAKAYLAYSSFSRSSLISQLEYEGFTHEQAVYGVEQNGY